MHEHDHLKHFPLEDLISEKIGAKEGEPAAKRLAKPGAQNMIIGWYFCKVILIRGECMVCTVGPGMLQSLSIIPRYSFK